MPIYEFYCPDNNKIYTFYARSMGHAGKTPRCPDGAGLRMEREISAFAITGKARQKGEKGELPEGQDPMDDPRMQSALAQMEREMSALDTNNPDPKMLARMMRRMSQLTGEKIPGQMDEMMRRMEAGEDLERLETEYGAAFDALEQGDAEGENPSQTLKARILRLSKAPVRDPMLYEMSEYV